MERRVFEVSLNTSLCVGINMKSCTNNNYNNSITKHFDYYTIY